jgi:hypothetical protein
MWRNLAAESSSDIVGELENVCRMIRDREREMVCPSMKEQDEENSV